MNNSTRSRSTYYVLTTNNYQQGIPNNVTNVYISEDLLQIPDKEYRKIFTVEEEDGIKLIIIFNNNMLNPNLH